MKNSVKHNAGKNLLAQSSESTGIFLRLQMNVLFSIRARESRDVSLGSGVATPRKKKTNRTESKTIQVEFEFSLLGT